MFTIDELKSWGTVPRVHPNGFIQIDKPGAEGKKARVHIWPDAELPKQGSHHPIHDHIFDMQSDVLKGEMTNRLFSWEFTVDPTHELYRARYKTPHDSTLVPTGKKGRVELATQITVPAGSGYWMPAFRLHESFVKVRPTVTFMQATKIYVPNKPVVAVPVDMTVDNKYSRYMMGPELWDIVAEAIR